MGWRRSSPEPARVSGELLQPASRELVDSGFDLVLPPLSPTLLLSDLFFFLRERSVVDIEHKHDVLPAC